MFYDFAKRAFNTSCDCEHLNLWLLHPYTLSWALTSELLSDAVILMEKTKERSAKILSTVYYAFSETQCYKWSLLLILLKYVDQDWRCSILKFMYILTVGFYVNKVLGICALFNCSFFNTGNFAVTPKWSCNYVWILRIACEIKVQQVLKLIIGYWKVVKDKYIDICWKIIHTSKTNSHMYMYAHVAVCEISVSMMYS